MEIMPIKLAVKAMVTCRTLHDIGARALYSTVITTGVPAQRFFSTIASNNPFSMLYSRFVRHLTFYSIDESDKYLTFPVLCEALLRLQGLRLLSLTLRDDDDSEFMHYCMLRYGIIRSSCSLIQAIANVNDGNTFTILSLPSLHTLQLYGGISLTDVVKFRPLTSLSVAAWQSYEDLARTTENLTAGIYASSLSSINLRLKIDLDMEKVMLSLSEMLPNLEILRLQQYEVDPLAVLRTLVSHTAIFIHLKSFLVNELSAIPPERFAAVSPDQFIAQYIQLTVVAGDIRPLSFVAFGPTRLVRYVDRSWTSDLTPRTENWWRSLLGSGVQGLDDVEGEYAARDNWKFI